MTSIAVHVESGRVQQSLTYLGAAIPHVVNADIQAVMEAAQAELQKPGAPIKYPVQWDSERQRRAFFATDGFGGGIPTKRTGAYQAGWTVKQTGEGLAREFTLSNSVNYSRYVGGTAYGKGQSNIHRGRWALAQEAVRGHVEAGLLQVRQDVQNAIRAEGMGL